MFLIALTNEELLNLLENDNELNEEQNHTKPLNPELEKSRQSLLEKIKRAQASLKVAEDISTKLTPDQQKEMERRLDNLQTLLFEGKMSLTVKQAAGYQVNPEERNLEILRKSAMLDSARVRSQKYAEGETNGMDFGDFSDISKQVNFDNSIIDKTSSHIRK